MKKMRLILFSVICVMLISGLSPVLEITSDVQAGEPCEPDPDTGPTYYQPGSWLLTSTWKGDDWYKNKTPMDGAEHSGLGCWSVAVGQILRYHELQSSGFVEIPTAWRTHVSSDLDDHQYVWPFVVDELDDTANCGSFGFWPYMQSKECREIDATSTFLYDVALVVGKKFTTTEYLYGFRGAISRVEAYFYHVYQDSCFRYTNPYKGKGGHDEDIEIIKGEIDHYRPVLLHIKGEMDCTHPLPADRDHPAPGHAVVIDGYEYRDGEFWVHINFGWNGTADDWYEYKDIGDTGRTDYCRKYDHPRRQLMFFRVMTPEQRMWEIESLLLVYKESGDPFRNLMIDQARDDIMAALNPDYWIGDGLHLDLVEGYKVFVNLSLAAVKLGFVRGYSDISFQKIQNMLASNPAILAKIALHEAKHTLTQNSWNLPIVAELIANAEREMEYAETYRTFGRYETAILRFGTAWELANRDKMRPFY